MNSCKKSGLTLTRAKRNSRLPLICSMQFAQILGTIKGDTSPVWTKQLLLELRDNNAVIVRIVQSGRARKERWISDANKWKRRMRHKREMKHRRTSKRM